MNSAAISSRLHFAIERVAPILGVCVGEDVGDRAAWRIDFKPEASTADRAAAAAAMEAFVFDPNALEVPASISDRQFFQQLAIEGTITNAEALAAVRVGTIPGVLQAFVNAIPDPAARFAADMVLSGATTFERLHPLSEAIRIAQGRTEAQRDEFFLAAAAL